MEFLNRFRPRHCHVLSLGAAKTGTTSIAHMLMGTRRSAHEAKTPETNQLVIDYLSGNVTELALSKALKSRDKALNLEFEASHPLGYFAAVLPSVFPQAKFIVTYREPHAWLKSRLNFHHGKQPQEWQAYRDFIWQRHFTNYAPQESALEAQKLYSIEAYLKQYREQYELLMQHLPKNRTLLVKTEQINDMENEISAFFALPANSVKATSTNTFSPEVSIIDSIDPDFVAAKVNTLCGDLDARLTQTFSSSI